MPSMSFEILYGAFVLLGGSARLEGSKVAAPAGLRIDLAGIEPVFAGSQFTDHRSALPDTSHENTDHGRVFLARALPNLLARSRDQAASQMTQEAIAKIIAGVAQAFSMRPTGAENYLAN